MPTLNLLNSLSVYPINAYSNIGKPLSALFNNNINVKDFGAKGDGLTNDFTAIQTALSSVSNYSRVYIPKGIYIVDQELKILNNTYLYGDGIGATIIKLSNSAAASQNVLTNISNTRSSATNTGNFNIVIKDLEVDGNVNRFYNSTLSTYSYSEGSSTSSCGVGLANVQHALIENVYSHDCCKHCFDIASSQNQSQSDILYTVGPSYDVTLKNVIAFRGGDDAITTHYSHSITIENACVSGKGGFLVPTNSNGIEIDDGSYDVTVIGGYVKNCIRGLEVKGHGDTPAAKRVNVYGLTCENNATNFELRHLFWDSGNSKTAFDVSLNDCTSIAPLSAENIDVTPRAMRISSYNGVYINNFKCVGNCNTSNLIYIYGGAKNVHINGMSFTGVSGTITEALLRIDSTAIGNMSLRNINFRDSIAQPIYITGNLPGILIDGVNATTTLATPPTFVIDMSYAPSDANYVIKNVTYSGYPSAYTLGSVDADYPSASNVEIIENILPANASTAQTVARYGWREGRSQGLNAGMGSKIDFTGNIVTGTGANTNQVIAHIGTEKINATDTDITSNLVFATASANNTNPINRFTISPLGAVTINGSLSSNGFIINPAGTMVAAGTTQATATAITKSYVEVDSGTGGVRLPNTSGGHNILIFNTTGTTISAYPHTGAQICIGGVYTSTNAPFAMVDSSGLLLYAISPTLWYGATL